MRDVEGLANGPSDDPDRQRDQHQHQDRRGIKRRPHILADEHPPAGEKGSDHAADIVRRAAVAEDRSALAFRRGVRHQFHEYRARAAEYEKHHGAADSENP